MPINPGVELISSAKTGVDMLIGRPEAEGDRCVASGLDVCSPELLSKEMLCSTESTSSIDGISSMSVE